ncbi:MAG: HPr family phosphocarrier protein [Gammaproteobacteria bacterium]
METPITIVNKLGLHARAAAKLVEVASQFNATCQLRRGEHIADCKSIMSLLILAASQHTRLTLCTQGSDAQDADAAIVQLIQGRFDENE